MRDLLVYLEATTGTEVWRVDFIKAVESPLSSFRFVSSPLVIGGHAYVHLRNQRFACLDLATGKEAWITKPFGRYWSMVAQGDRILPLDETGDLRLIRARPDAFELVGVARVAEEESRAHLALDGDTLLVRDLAGLTAWRWR